MSNSNRAGYQTPLREIGLRDLVFMSIGGQSPFLSILIYGLAAYIIGGPFAPIAILLGTLLVMVNGIVTYRLSRRFTQSGGYYVYAYYSLSRLMGFVTGWMYIYYAVLYGSAYALGTIAIASSIIRSLDSYQLALLFMPIPSMLAILGKRPSFRYAMFASSLEIGMMTLLGILFLHSTRFTFYNPFSEIPPASVIAAAVLFGSGIPTGYGSITPLSGEVKNARRTVPTAVITVILIGGLLASFDVYAIADHVTFFNLQVGRNESFLSLIHDAFGPATLILALLAALNDGILATLTFMFATSRTMFAMALHGFLPSKLGELKEFREPLNAVLVTVAIYLGVVFPALKAFNGDAYDAFITVAFMSVLGNLFVHLAADLSLLRISFRRFWKRKLDFALSVGATLFTIYVILTSIPRSSRIGLGIFTVWLLLGFIIGVLLVNLKKEEAGEEGA